MSATLQTNTQAEQAAGGCIAHVDFRVRCETLGHGEDVFLVKSDDPNLSNVSRAQNSTQKCVGWGLWIKSLFRGKS
jgi:hypothetical protein